MAISERLLKEIEYKRDLAISSSEYWLQRGNKLRHAIEKSAKNYEYYINHPELRFDYGPECTGKKRGEKIVALKKGVKNLFNAWAYISHTDSYLTEDVLFNVAKLVDPFSNSGYRDFRVSLNLSKYTPPNHLKVNTLICELFEELEGRDKHPIEMAADAHLSFVGIQPFPKGNKRIAQLFQNRILYGADLPAFIVPLSEREVYCGLLEDGLVSKRRKTMKGKNRFHNYIGSKVNLALDEILENVKSNGNHK